MQKWWRHLNFQLKYFSLESFIASKIRTKFRPQFTCSLLNLLALKMCWPENTCAGTRGRVMDTWGTAPPGDVTWGRWVGLRREWCVESGVPSKKILKKLLHKKRVAVYLLARTRLARQLDTPIIRTTAWVEEEEREFISLPLRSQGNLKFGYFTSLLDIDGKEMYRKGWSTSRIVH